MHSPTDIRLASRLRACATAALLTASAIAARQQPATSGLPFEDLGKRVLTAADAASAQPAAKDAKLLDRLAPLHVRVPLGAFELWVPNQALGPLREVAAGPKPRDVAPAVVGLLELEHVWLRRLASHGADFDAALAALEQLRPWGQSFKRIAAPAGEDATRALERVERALLLAAPVRRAERLIVIVAPTRAQFLGLLGAAGVVDARERPRLWLESARRSSGEALSDHVSVLALSTATRPDEDPLVGAPFEPALSAQWIVHMASHLLSVRITPMVPGWWSEGLAICDTIHAMGTDETMCTGYSAEVSTPMQGLSETSKILVWVSREVSPYRKSSAQWFDGPLRKARTRGGFQVVDLSTEKPVLDLGGPFLGDNYAVDLQVASASAGVKRGFAELYRAYSAAFLHWLDTDEHADPTLLAVLCRELAKVPYDPWVKVSPLYEIARTITGMTLGSVLDPKIDLEGSFMASLAAK